MGSKRTAVFCLSSAKEGRGNDSQETGKQVQPRFAWLEWVKATASSPGDKDEVAQPGANAHRKPPMALWFPNKSSAE